MDIDWTPAKSKTRSVREGKRKVPESLRIMESDSDDDEPVIVSMESGSKDTERTPPIQPAQRDVVTPAPASIFVRLPL